MKKIIAVLKMLLSMLMKSDDEKEKKAINRAKKAVEKMQLYIAEFMTADIDSLHVSVTKGNRKIGRVLNVSLAPIITCLNCLGCLKLCYDIKAILQYKNVAIARAKNYVILIRDRDKYFNEIIETLKHRKTNKFFRWHVAGDIIDVDYFDRMVKIARMFPDFRFWTYTKAYVFVNKWVKENGKENLPQNLTVMFSEWKGMKMDNPYKFPEFRVWFHSEPKPTKVHWCPGNCEICLKSKTGCPYGQTTYCEEH